MINRIGKWFDYLSYLLYSTNRHGVHSPFVYEFVDKVLYNSAPSKNEFLEYQRTLMVQSKSIGYDGVSLSEYVNTYTLPSKYCELLQRIVLFYDIKLVNEIGPSTGLEYNYIRYLSSTDLAPNLKLFSTDKIEPYTSLFNKSQKEFDKVFSQKTDHEEALDGEYFASGSPIKKLLLFHRLDRDSDFWNSLDRELLDSTNQDFFVFTHPYHNETSRLNWQRIVNQPDFHVTIDCFYLGIAIKRTQQVKEHFQLRY